MNLKPLVDAVKQLYKSEKREASFLVDLYNLTSRIAYAKLRGILKKRGYYMSLGEVEERAHDVATRLVERHMKNPAYTIKYPAVMIYLEALNILYDRRVVRYESMLCDLDESLSGEDEAHAASAVAGEIAHLESVIEASATLEEAYLRVANFDPVSLHRHYLAIAKRHSQRTPNQPKPWPEDDGDRLRQIEFEFASIES